jgi:sugar phosphate isomerase/epimerase
MRLAMSNIAWAPEERLEAYAALAEAGFTGLEIAPGLLLHAAEDPFDPDAATLRTALDEVAGAGLTLVSMQSLLFGVPGAALFGDADARMAFEAAMRRAIALGGRLGIPNLVFGSPAQRRVPEGMAMDAAVARGAEVFRRLGDHAAAHGTAIAIEANPAAYGTNFCNTLEEAESFVGTVDHPAVRMILDLGAQIMNGTLERTAGLLPRIAPRLNHVHVSEPDLAPAPAPGRPATLAPVFAALAAEGYAGAVSIEMKRPAGGLAEVRAAIDRLADGVRMMGAAHA